MQQYRPFGLLGDVSYADDDPRRALGMSGGGASGQTPNADALGQLLYGLTNVGGLQDAAGLLGGPSMAENWREGNKGAAALQGAGMLPVVGGALKGLLGGAAKAIVPIAAAKRLNVAKALPSSGTFERAVENLPGATIEDGSLVLPIARRQMSSQNNQPSVRGGVFYLPQGDKRLSYYSGKNGYGGQDKIAGETAVSNPMFVKGATGGKAPEAAYAALFGNDAMKQLDRDVFSAVNDKYWMNRQDPTIYPDRIAGLLDNYGADPSIASYLIDNSTQGNQLRYALQENIIGNAVRNAGHDAILGYSMGRGRNPFFSELFDLRESHYPGVNGEYRVWDRFNPAP